MTPRGDRPYDGPWGWFLRTAFLPAGDAIFGQRMMSRLRFLEDAQWWPRERIESERDASLRSLIAAATEVPFYRELWDGAGVDPRSITSADALRRLPVVDKQVLRDAYPDRVTRPTGRKPFESRTSGSTGTNFAVLNDSESIGTTRAAFMLMLQWAGWRIGEPHLQTGMNLGRSLDRVIKDTAMRCTYMSAYDLTDQHLDSMLDAIERRSIRHVWGYPGSMYLLAQYAKRRGRTTPLRTVVTWGDMLYDAYRREIEEAFGVRVTDTYGCAEGIQVAAQCGVEDGYHSMTLDTVVELLDDAGEPVTPGEAGSVVLTRLFPGPMPLIRYRVGDIAVAGPEERCACGRAFERISRIEGRDTDVVVTPTGNRLIVHFFTGILEHFREIDSFQVVQDDAASMTLRLVPAEGFTDAIRDAAVARLRERGADLHIDVEVVDVIPVGANGKRRFVMSTLGRRPDEAG
jgi:phenylacetate-CoA ligase